MPSRGEAGGSPPHRQTLRAGRRLAHHAVAVKTLTEPGHHGKIYELTGPALLSFQEMIDKLSAFTGVSLVYVDVPEAARHAECGHAARAG